MTFMTRTYISLNGLRDASVPTVARRLVPRASNYDPVIAQSMFLPLSSLSLYNRQRLLDRKSDKVTLVSECVALVARGRSTSANTLELAVQ
jgi:hypothetical protein